MPKRKRDNDPLSDDTKGLATSSAECIREDFQDYCRTEVPGCEFGHRRPYQYNDAHKRQAFEKARYVSVSNYWLASFLKLKRSVINYGFELTPASGGAKLSKWLKTKVELPDTGNPLDMVVGVPGGVKTNGERLFKFVRDSISEYILLDSVIACWLTGQGYATCLDHKQVRYSDIFGIETLFYRHCLSLQQIKLLEPELQKMFLKPEVALDEAQGMFFKVLKEERDGFGLPWPAVQSIFRTLATMESMEISESGYAYGGRLKFRHHKVGHEIKQGNNAGKPTHFWNTKRGAAVHKIFDKKGGYLGDFVSNFDHAVEFPHEDEKFFAESKWLSPEHRLVKWGGALAEMLLIEGVTPFTSQLLRAQITETRDNLKSFLETVINEAFDLPTSVEINWSDEIFNNAQIAAQLLQFGVSCGAVSQSTFREQAGFNDVREAEKKMEEAAAFKKNPQAFKPAYDPAHGDPNAKGGAPAGNVNKDHA